MPAFDFNNPIYNAGGRITRVMNGGVQLWPAASTGGSSLAILDTQYGSAGGYGTAKATFLNVKAGDQILMIGSLPRSPSKIKVTDSAGNLYDIYSSPIEANDNMTAAVATCASDSASLDVGFTCFGAKNKFISAVRISGGPVALNRDNIRSVWTTFPGQYNSTVFATPNESVILWTLRMGFSGYSGDNSIVVDSAPDHVVDYTSYDQYRASTYSHAIGPFNTETITYHTKNPNPKDATVFIAPFAVIGSQ